MWRDFVSHAFALAIREIMKSIQNALTVLLFCTVVAGVYLYFMGDLSFQGGQQKPEVSKTGFLKTEQEFRDKLAELRLDRDKVIRRKQLLQDRKSETVELLKSKGVTADSDLNDADTKYAVQNLKRYVADLKGMDGIVEKYDKPIAAIEAMLVRIEQDQIAADVAISDEKAEQLGVMLLDLDDRLGVGDNDVFEESELRDLLSDELGK